MPPQPEAHGLPVSFSIYSSLSFFPCQVREDPTLEPTERTYTAAINCFQMYAGGSPVASLSSTMVDVASPPQMSSTSTLVSPSARGVDADKLLLPSRDGGPREDERLDERLSDGE